MNGSSDTGENTRLGDLLDQARELAEGGEYTKALERVRSAKSSRAGNVYVLAFEKQMEQLVELFDSGTLRDEQRTDILDSIPGIIERAVQSDSGGTGAGPAPSSVPRGGAPADPGERTAALEWLKNQYFQHAHEYVKKGEYQHALTEIRRVFIIDPKNSIARDFEQQIEELSRMKITGPGPGSPSETTAPAESPAPSPRPAQRQTQTPPTVRKEAASEPPAKKKLNALSIIALLAALVLLALGTVYVISRLQSSKTAPTTKGIITAPQRDVYYPDPTVRPQQQPVRADSARPDSARRRGAEPSRVR